MVLSKAPTSSGRARRFCTLQLDSELLVPGGPGLDDVVGVTAEISGPCIVGGGIFSAQPVIVVTDFGWYNGTVQKFALAGTRFAPNVTIYDNFVGNTTP